MKLTKTKCECPEKERIVPSRLDQYLEEELKGGVNHEPNECKGANNIKWYDRNGKKLWLCSRCCLLGDVEL